MKLKNTRKIIIPTLICVLVFGLAFPNCSYVEKKKYKIGFSQCTGDDLWRQTMHKEMLRTAMFYDNIELEIKDAQGNSEKQIEQINEFINDKVDLLIISPNESGPITSIAVNAFKKGIPTILVDRKIDSPEYTAFIGGDNYAIGYDVGQYLAQITHGKASVLEVWGLIGSSPANERNKGFSEAIALFPDIKITRRVYGNWLGNTAFEQVSKINDNIKIDALFAHNDVMALGARKALGKKSDSIIFLSIDALPGKLGGIQKVIDGELTASFLYPTGGKEAIELAVKILNKQVFVKQNLLSSAVIDKSNASIIQKQNLITTAYTEDIDKQQDKLLILNSKYIYLKNLNIAVTIILILLIVLISISIRAYRRKNVMNRKLNETNKVLHERQILIEEQSEKLRIQKDELSLTNATKDKLFSILAHDLKNPFNVIIGFSELLLSDIETLPQDEVKNYLQLINSSSTKVNDLLENILQWSQARSGRIAFKIQLIDIHKIVEDCRSLLEGDLFRKTINFKNLIEPETMVNADANMLKAICRNLISNAIKFTPKNGTITLKSKEIAEPPCTQISISDTGIGIPEKIISKLFQINKTVSTKGTENEHGTGLGLILCKEFVEKHKGKIWVESKVNEGTTFFFTLPVC